MHVGLYKQPIDYPAQSIPLHSSYIHSIWQGVAPRDDIHTAAADGNLDLVVMKRAGRVRILLSGPTSAAQRMPYKKGDENIGIRLRRGVYLPALPARKMLNVDRFLPNAGAHAFWFEGSAIAFPTFDTTEPFIDKLVRLGILRRDVVIEDALQGRMRGTSLRTVQRHFLEVTGMTPYYVSQIQRAEVAQELLQQGRAIEAVAYETGFSDQSHMTTSLKRLIGRTPGQIRSLGPG